MDEDEPWLRHPWEDADPPPVYRGTEALLMARAQDAVARLEHRRCRAARPLALFEAAGFLAHCGPAVHRTTSRCATPTSPVPTPSPRSPAGCAKPRRGETADGGGGAVAVGDHPVADALAYGRHGGRLAELATWRRRAASGNCREAPAHGCRPRHGRPCASR